MKEYVWTFIFNIVNTIILFIFLKWLLFKPIKNFLDRRTQRFEAKIEELKKRESEIEENKRLSREELEKVRQQVKTIMEQAERIAQERIQEAQQEAQRQAEAILEQARRQIEQEREQAVEAVKAQAVNLAVELASKVLQSHITPEQNKAIIEKFLEKVET
ncbi:MAG: F0F1 ATP synthase subunit B [Caldicoprobacter oshimai]|uniref:ATP synthase subunit b n=1 Tax=Caldicoprobacter faecalis TaxID=937334 RepID=A0A1I5RY26_9FIRM|nr:F0F1 ATP synthase subunit B [Caldicoprobacter faecalis]PZN12193.1 MAG: ATP synthase F0 subunit B [Caldicoprobacter oshimai]SFP62906.1 ATP synthase F0 subcomplex B subunit [Caldicoprobacter faecalis]